ncbi:MAG: M56 family metallopeptidase [Bacteroidota bacterium]
MISYIITSSLLVIPTWLVYIFLVRNRTSLRRQKTYLYVAVIGSLSFPLLVSPSTEISLFGPSASNIEAIGFGHQIDHASLQNYCRCENPNYAHRIRYRANGWYNFLFKHKIWFTYAILLAMGGVGLTFVLQLLYLHRLVRSSHKESINIDGQNCVLLHTGKSHSVGAFRLGKSYIVWQDELAELTTQERLAIFRHELSHLKQFNTLEKAALRLLQCLWLINPVFYVLRKELNLLSEFLADESGASALAKKQSYAHLLVHLQSLNNIPLVMHFQHSQLRKRIERLIYPPAPSRLPVWQMAVGAIFAFQYFCASPLAARVSSTLNTLQTYEVISQKIAPDAREAVYCTDCETVCTQDE